MGRNLVNSLAMTKAGCTIALGLVSLPLASHASPAAKVPAPVGEEKLSLDGTWLFTTDPDQAKLESGGWTAMQVPGNWDAHPDFLHHKGKGWYRRSFEAPEGWRGKSVRIRFEAVYHDAEVTLDGTVLGTHSGGYTPFEFDVSHLLKYGESNTITVMADNSYGRGAWWHWGGISRSVSLLANNDIRIVRQHIRAVPDLEAGTARISIQ